MARKLKNQLIKEAKGEAKRSFFRLLRLKFALPLLLLAFLGALGFTFVPEESVPPALEMVHTYLLRQRNHAVRATGLPVSLYEDAVRIEDSSGRSVLLYFAPSPRIAGALAEFIGTAVSTLYVCIYDLDLENVADALINAKNRGVTVKVVTDSDNYALNAVRRLLESGIEVVPDNRKSIMHNKFVVADAARVWTGSFNFTENCAGKNDNNALVLESPELAAGYIAKFDEYWEGHFGKKAELRSENASVKAGSIPVRYAFSPSDGVRRIILEELSGAKQSVDVMAFSFTDNDLAIRLAELVRKGVAVRCLFDNGQAGSKYSRKRYLAKAGAKVYPSPNRTGKMHHKVIIIDNATVITGSYNYSRNAEESNDENIVVLRCPAIAHYYTKEFNRCIRGTKGY